MKMHHTPHGLRTVQVRRRLLVIGGACWDWFLVVERLRHALKNPVRQRCRCPGGGAVNHALGQRQLDSHQPIALLAQVGDDAEGRALRQTLTTRGIAVSCPPVPGVATSSSVIVVEEGDGRCTAFCDPGARAVPLPLELVDRELAGARACCLIAPTVAEQTAPILALAAEHGVAAYLGLSGNQVTQLGYGGLDAALAGEAALVMCNRHEAQALTGQEDIRDQLEALRFGGKVRLAVVSDGAAGLRALDTDRAYEVGAYRDSRPVVSDLGAGDASLAGLLHLLLRGYPVEAALQGAARQGFEACTALGATAHLLNGLALREYLSVSAVAAP
jgi:sugar/nucleoside kinase (ribokinase family)